MRFLYIFIVFVVSSCGFSETKQKDKLSEVKEKEKTSIIPEASSYVNCIEELYPKVDTFYYKVLTDDSVYSLVEFVGVKFEPNSSWKGYLIMDKKKDSICDCIHTLQYTKFDTEVFLKGEIGYGFKDNKRVFSIFQFDTVNTDNFATNMYEAIVVELSSYEFNKNKFEVLEIDSQRLNKRLMPNPKKFNK